ncbi:CD44 antigen isoform X27 [Cygnus atratus]|uniref:CD44 antigen isoform X26 n=1 Tax=Cygnus atratus TaxID=8868 RepID=UPI0021B71036|nr:CD44 antigen isoform X26 [Cygnus atratus]XP_050567149.1 CD44 antigen isoform X27 [Cygnus atratus]
MASFYVWVTFGLCLLKLCLTETQFNVSCRYRGVFHVEKNGRYSLTRTEAADLCRALNSTLSTLEQLEKAHELGFETCRYGFIVGHIAIPRINPYHLCAANHTGIYKLSANTTGRYDAYCYNATETRDKACEPIERIDTSFLNNQSEIVIDNEDGSRYNADGTRHSGDSSTSGVDDENVGSGSSHDTTPVDTSIRRSSPSYYGSVTPVSHLSDHSSGGGEKDFPVKNSDDEISPTSTDISLVTGFNDFAKEDDEWHRGSTTPGPHRVHLEKTTTQTWWNPFSNEWWWSNPREKTQEPTQTTRADVTSSGNGSDDEDSSEETTYPTVFPGWDISVAKKEYAPSTTPGPHRVHLEKTTTQTWWNPFSNEWWWSNPREKTQEPTQTTRADVTSSGNGSDDEDSSEETTYPTVFPGWDISVAKKEYAPSTRSTSIIDGDHGSRKGNVEPTSNPGENATTTITSQPRSAQVPEWLIIVAALLALALILAVCIAVSSRRRCGQKKKLVINNGKGAVEDRKTSELNGDASKSQEMVHLVHKEQSNDRTGASDEFLTIDETQNHQELDMKSGV